MLPDIASYKEDRICIQIYFSIGMLMKSWLDILLFFLGLCTNIRAAKPMGIGDGGGRGVGGARRVRVFYLRPYTSIV